MCMFHAFGDACMHNVNINMCNVFAGIHFFTYNNMCLYIIYQKIYVVHFDIKYKRIQQKSIPKYQLQSASVATVFREHVRLLGHSTFQCVGFNHFFRGRQNNSPLSAHETPEPHIPFKETQKSDRPGGQNQKNCWFAS